MPYNGFCRSSFGMRCGVAKTGNFSEVLSMLNETKAQNRHKLTLIAAYFAVYFIWGSTYLAIRFSVETLPPFLTGALRFLLAGILLYGIASLRSPARPTWKGWKLALQSSFFSFFICFGGLTYAQRVVPSAVASLLIALEAVWFTLFDWLFFKGRRPSRLELVAIFVGFLGCVVLIAGDPNARWDANPGYFFWSMIIILLGFSWVFGALLARKEGIHENVFMASAMQMLCGGVMLTGASLFMGDWQHVGTVSAKSIAAVAYLVIFGSLIAYSAYLWLLRNEPASRVATHVFVNPMIAVFLGWFFAGEELSLNMAIAAALIILSVVMTIYANKRPNLES